MTWIKLDDQSPDHPKLAGLSDRAFRWWIRGLCYASRYLTDGLLPPTFFKQAHAAVRAELTRARLWEFDDPNLRIHAYLEHQQSRETVENERRRQRDRRRTERGTTERRTPGTTAVRTDELPRPPNIREEGDTEKNTVPPAPARPLVSGQANPRDWGRIHGNHVSGFCDWVCLPDFVFEEFRSKSPGPEYVTDWAQKIRTRYEGTTIGEDGLKFWRGRWAEAHATPRLTPKRDDAAILARLQAIERGEVKR